MLRLQWALANIVKIHTLWLQLILVEVSFSPLLRRDMNAANRMMNLELNYIWHKVMKFDGISSHEMLNQNVIPDEFVYATLIDGFIRNENLSEAKKVFEFMDQQGIKHGIVGYNVMIKGYCKFGMTRDALLYLKRMKCEGYLPDEFTYTTIINGYAKQFDLDEAMWVFIDMMKHRCKPNIVTYSALINGYCQKGDTDTAEVLFKYMKCNNVTPNVFTYSILIGSLFRNGKNVKAISLFENMLQNKCLPNDVTLHHLIKGLTDSISTIELISSINLQHQHEHAVFSFFRNMILDGWDHRTAAYNFIIFCLCKHAMLKNALDLRGKMIGNCCSPDCITFLFLLHGVCAVGKSEEWNNILSSHFQQSELEMAIKYAGLMDEYLYQGKCSEASLILQNLLKGSAGSPEVSFSLLLRRDMNAANSMMNLELDYIMAQGYEI